MTGLSTDLDTVYIASSRFEAARVLQSLDSANKFRRLHGHGFMVSARANLPRDWARYPGGELPRLLQELTRQAQRLNYRSLNDVLLDPSDLNTASWLSTELNLPGLIGLDVQSTPDQGVSVGEQGNAQHEIWRRYRFQAAHRLPNVPAGHKCGRMHGHGFEVVLRASINEISSKNLLTYDTLDHAWARIASELKYRCLNDINGLENPTSEILASWIWQRLKDVLPELSLVTVFETASCGASFDGQSYRIWKDFSIDSAIKYRRAVAGDPRSSLHGYTYTLRLHLSAPLDQVMGWTVDFGDVKAVFDPVFKSLDHHPLHENVELAAISDGDTSSIAQWLFVKSRMLIPQLVRIDLFETEGCGALVGTGLPGSELPLARVTETGVTQE